jgi:membrane-associated phospholipid phosphatase
MGALARWVGAPDGGLNRGRLAVTVTCGYVLFAGTYLPINLFSVGRAAHQLWLPGETRIPLVPEFEFLYLLTYVLPLCLVAWLPDARAFRRTGLAFALTIGAAYATYLLFPVYLERPALEVGSLATYLLSLEYHDPSYNHFPSLHVAISWLVYLACRDVVRLRGVFLMLVIGISISTVFVKQHYAVDVLAGALLAWGSWAAAGRWASRASRQP